jgi:hypothetical protein
MANIEAIPAWLVWTNRWRRFQTRRTVYPGELHHIKDIFTLSKKFAWWAMSHRSKKNPVDFRARQFEPASSSPEKNNTLHSQKLAILAWALGLPLGRTRVGETIR